MEFDGDEVGARDEGRRGEGEAVKGALAAVRVAERRGVEADIAFRHIVTRDLGAVERDNCAVVGHDVHGGFGDQLRDGDLELPTEIDGEMAVRVNFRPAQFVADDVSESQRRGAGPPGGTVEGRLPPRGAHIDAVVQVAPRCGAFCEPTPFLPTPLRSKGAFNALPPKANS